MGLRNPNSLTDAIGHFEKALLPPAAGTIPIILLGEVDCGLLFGIDPLDITSPSQFSSNKLSRLILPLLTL